MASGGVRIRARAFLLGGNAKVSSLNSRRQSPTPKRISLEVVEAQGDGYQSLISTDQNLKYQQNLSDRKLAIIVLLSTSWPRIQRRVEEIQTAVDEIGPGDYRAGLPLVW